MVKNKIVHKAETPEIWRRERVLEKTGISAATLYRLEQSGDFPQKVQLGPGSVGWISTEIEAWIVGRMAARNAEVNNQKGE